MSELDSPRYYVCTLELGREPNYKHAAATLNLLKVNGLSIEPLNAVEGENESMLLPFLVTKSDDSFMNAYDPRERIEGLSPFPIKVFELLDPKKAQVGVIEQLVKLTVCHHGIGSPIKVSDIKPPNYCKDEDCVEEAFSGLVGMDAQRKLLTGIGKTLATYGPNSLGSFHMTFTGSPGTGKSEVAKRMHRYMVGVGALRPGGQLIKAGESDLVARYEGQTPIKTRGVIDKACGGVLFIDEAYSLMHGSDFGQEAIDTLVELLDERRGEFVCVIAGYPREIDELLDSNPGLRDRFAFNVPFADYTNEELTQIVLTLAAARNFAVDEHAERELPFHMGILRERKGFSNARTARLLLDRAIISAACEHGKMVLLASDFAAAMEQPDLCDMRGRQSHVGFLP